MSTEVNPAPDRARRPEVPLTASKAAFRPAKAMMGSPVTPLPFKIDRPLPPANRVRTATVVAVAALQPVYFARQGAYFVYQRNGWYVAARYATLEQAQEYWGRWPITAKEWRG